MFGVGVVAVNDALRDSEQAACGAFGGVGSAADAVFGLDGDGAVFRPGGGRRRHRAGVGLWLPSRLPNTLMQMLMMVP